MEDTVIKLTVNKMRYSFHIDKRETLLDVLRERLDLTGTKLGCGHGKCGACTVVMNGKAVTACTIRGQKMDGVEVTTIEGLADGYELHPIQRAFVQSDKVDPIQCGFCTPGFVMRLYALFNQNLGATEEEILEALSHNLCRCTGYEEIIKAAKLAQKYMKEKK